MGPEPTFTFTIPSVHDDIALDCRVYNPPHSVLYSVEASWYPRGAIIAHPYAPLGGSYDDEVVLSAAAESLDRGFVVGTFNFRQATMASNIQSHRLINLFVVVLAVQKAGPAGRRSPSLKTISHSLASSCTMLMASGLLAFIHIHMQIPIRRCPQSHRPVGLWSTPPLWEAGERYWL